MKLRKVLSSLLSVCMILSVMPSAAFAADGITGDMTSYESLNAALEAIKDTPGAEATYTEGNLTHPIQMSTNFDFVVDEIAYSYVSGESGSEVTVSPWTWFYQPHSCSVEHNGTTPRTLYSGDTGGKNIPAQVEYNSKTYSVVGVDASTFASVSNSPVTLPEGIKTIGMDAFYNYSPGTYQENFVIPASVTEIDQGAFGACHVPFTFATGSHLTTIGDIAFDQINLPEFDLVLPDGVKTVGERLFDGSTVKSVTIPGTVENLTPQTLSGYTGEIEFTDGPAKFQIEDGVLYGWGKLIQVRDKNVISITVPDDITEIGDLAFANLKSLQTVTLPESLTTIGYGAFSGCTSLTSIEIPSGVTELTAPPSINRSEGMFYKCTSLTSVAIRGNITAIPANTFNGCSKLSEVSLPDSVTDISYYAFNGCSSMKSFDFSDIESIGEQAFGSSGITDVSNLDSLESLGNNAFMSCSSLKTVVIPDGMTEIPTAAFALCGSIETVILPSSVTELGMSAFNSAFSSSGGTIVMIGDTPPEIGQYNFNMQGTKPESLKVFYPETAEAAYKETILVGESEDNGYALSLTPSSTTMALASNEDGTGSTLTLNGVTVPEGMTLEVSSSNEQVATAAFAGGKLTVTGVGEGTATITATLSVNGYTVLTDTCEVTVTNTGAVVPDVKKPDTSVGGSLSSASSDDKTAATTVAGSVQANDAITTAANREAADLNNNTTMRDELIASGKKQLSDQNVTLYTQTYLEIKATDLEKGTGEQASTVTSITLDITPKMQVVASTAADSASVVIKENNEGDGNAVVVQDPKTLAINTPAQITVTLPDGFKRQTVYIAHEKNGRTYYYHAEANENGQLTFTSQHGFSPFTFSLVNGAVTEVDGVGYSLLQDAINEADANDTITLLKGGLSATVSRDLTFENGTNEPITVTINGRSISIDGNETYNYEYVAPSHGGSGGSSTTRYTVSVEDADNGSIRVSPSRAERGDTVTITVAPDEGYELDTLTVTDANGDRIDVERVSDTRYTFEMPRSRVTVEATFVEQSTEPEPVELPFTDVANTAWYYDAVAYCYENGMMAGTSSTTFDPNSTTTRGMIVTILHRLEGTPDVTTSSGFADVAAGLWYTDAVDWAAANGIVGGYGDGNFGPNDTITREQMAAILYRYAQYKGYDMTASADLSGYADVSEISSYAVPALQWANAEGLIEGTSATTLSPKGSATRAQVATILMRFCETVAR